MLSRWLFAVVLPSVAQLRLNPILKVKMSISGTADTQPISSLLLTYFLYDRALDELIWAQFGLRKYMRSTSIFSYFSTDDF